MDSFLVGIDVSKDLFSVLGIDSEGDESFSGSYSMDSSGFEELIQAITSHCEDLSKVRVGMESTGCYHINLYSFSSNTTIKGRRKKGSTTRPLMSVKWAVELSKNRRNI